MINPRFESFAGYGSLLQCDIHALWTNRSLFNASKIRVDQRKPYAERYRQVRLPKIEPELREQSERVVRAMGNPYFNIFAHPTGR